MTFYSVYLQRTVQISSTVYGKSLDFNPILMVKQPGTLNKSWREKSFSGDDPDKNVATLIKNVMLAS